MKILKKVNTEKLNSYKCKVRSHRKLYYCGMFLYLKPFLLTKKEETFVISTQTCRDMASTKTCVTPKTWKSDSLVVPGQSYIIEFEVGFQKTLSSSIQSQGMDVLLEGSIQKGIVQHTEYVVTVEEEIFMKNHEHVIARSSSEKLRCNPHGPSLGCVGTLHTYAWKPPKTSCLFCEVRELEGVFSTWFFEVEDDQIYY